MVLYRIKMIPTPENEWWYDRKERHLYYIHNATATGGSPLPPAGWQFAVTRLQTLINISGASAANATAVVQDLSFEGVAFSGASCTYLSPHGTPSGAPRPPVAVPCEFH